MDPAALIQLAQQATNILVPALSALCIAGKPAVDKGKEVLVDLIYEKAFEKLGSESGKRAQALLEKISPKMSASLEKALTKVLRNSQDPKAEEELQQEILNLLTENPGLVKEIKHIVINFNVKKVDQLTVGNGNSSFNFKNTSGDQYIQFINYPNEIHKEKANQNDLRHYTPSVLPEYSETLKLFVTENRSEELRKALTYLENHRVLLISGVGGIGKSTLARALVDLRPVNVPEPFWFDFNQNQSAKLGDILEKLASYLKAPEIAAFKEERREPGKLDVDKLTGEFQRRSEVWLIFDDLSTVLEDQHFADDGIELLFYSLRHNTHNAKTIVTSRTLPIFKNGEKLIDVVENEDKQDLKGLNKDFAVDYLASNGLDEVEPEKLEELAIGVDGHPLALKILVELVKEFGATDVIQDLSLYRKDKEDTIIKARKLFDKLAGSEKELLERISVYREPVRIKGLNEMFTENTPANAIRKLIDKFLLETNHNGNYWLHPLVQEFSYEDLKNKKEAHMLAVKYYLSLSLPENPAKKEDLQPAIEAHYHACEAGEFNLAAQIILYPNLHIYLDTWGEYFTLITLYRRLLPSDPFNHKVLLSKEISSSVYGGLGITYKQLGYVKEAIKYYKKALKISREIGDRRGEGNQLGNLGNIYFYLGKTGKAIEYYNQTLIIHREIGDKRGEEADLGNLGLAYNQLGEIRKAIEYHEQALKIAREVGNKRREGADFGNLGLAYSDLGETRKAIEYHEQALKIAREISDRQGECADLGNLGLAYNDLGETRKAIEHYERALKISREIGDRRGEGASLGSLGVAYSDLGEIRKAIEYHEQALKIARKIGDKHGEGSQLGNLGNICIKFGKARKAIEYHEQALKISREIGDKRGECTDLGNLGSVYSQLGKIRKAIEYYEQALKVSKEVGDRRAEGINLGNLGLAYSDLGEIKKAIEFLKKSLAIGKAIEDPRIISLCEQKLKELDGIENSENSDYYLTSNNPPVSSRPPVSSHPPASKNLFQTIVSKLKSKK
jgi:tetratricopeptide (TPR) repeat protein